MADELLDIVDDNDQVIGQALRSEAHKNKLLHREVNVWFVTPQKEIIFQKRSLLKENYPGLLTVTAGGHVSSGEDYQAAIIKEIFEETGFKVYASDLIFLGFKKFQSFDEITNSYNNSIRAFYGYIYNGEIEALKVEQDAGSGFEKMPLRNILNLPEVDRKRITPSLLDGDKYADIYETLEKLVS